ncbi:hypothetical protein P170DRAFT_439889 [Aspergillus steynii IBT 23096]|uniref:Uncharacterized protein n=1 Tax=Aspergillus steynii IBT 23096 TaxID=1392250 RepID=A0A2I2G053_9EURO|nr:uncharacterized protein P170DRAFT_439889 [Aspergillus steynii IBT 23096]PLB46265.1 hypothetical protein P170DRAFT_439889 [Aspergillus steynii IBT 23096]
MRRLKRPNYLLDVMIVNEWDFWPTWLSVPVLRTHLDEVNANFRIFGHCLSGDKVRWITGDGGHDGPEWCFYAMLERFLVHGPLTEPSKPKKQTGRKFYIKTLTLNFESAAGDQYYLAPSTVRRRLWAQFKHLDDPEECLDLSLYAPRPEWPAKILYSELVSLLRLSEYIPSYGLMFFEHIGKMRLLVEGRLYQEFDITAIMAPNTFNSTMSNFSRTEGREDFWRWKLDTLRKRQEAGLPVIWSDDPGLDRYL